MLRSIYHQNRGRGKRHGRPVIGNVLRYRTVWYRYGDRGRGVLDRVVTAQRDTSARECRRFAITVLPDRQLRIASHDLREFTLGEVDKQLDGAVGLVRRETLRFHGVKLILEITVDNNIVRVLGYY